MRAKDEPKYDLNTGLVLESKFPYFEADNRQATLVPCVIDGINTDEGIRNSGGHLKEYVEMLRLFCIEAATIADNLPTYCGAGSSLFRMKLHGVRNNCGSIGAIDLMKEALRIETGNARHESVIEEVKIFSENLKNVIRNIKNYLDTLNLMCIAEKAAVDKEKCMIPGVPREEAIQLRSILQKLEKGEAMEKIRHIREKEFSKEIEIYLNRLVEMIDQYEYAEAVALLERITEQI